MGFTKVDKQAFPPRHWSIIGAPAVGKSSFAARMRGPILVIDADHRFGEVAGLAAGDVYQVSADPADHNDAERVAAALRSGMAGGVRVGTIVIDSLTAILSPLVSQAVMDNDADRNRNKMAAWKPKAMAMRLLQDNVTQYGADTLWIYHERDGRDAKGGEQTVATVPRTELARLQRSLNMRLRVVIDDAGRRGVNVEWARSGRSGGTVWDDSRSWVNMPERIEQAVYGGLSAEEQAKLADAVPTAFTGPDHAIGWGFEQGCFDAIQHARAAYDKLKGERKPKSAGEMWALWVEDVQRRMAEMEHETPASPEPTGAGF
jgi:hypothetical protein